MFTRAEMARREPRLVPLGYGKLVRADRLFALGRRTQVHVEGALVEAAGVPRRRRAPAVAPEQERLI